MELKYKSSEWFTEDKTSEVGFLPPSNRNSVLSIFRDREWSVWDGMLVHSFTECGVHMFSLWGFLCFPPQVLAPDPPQPCIGQAGIKNEWSDSWQVSLSPQVVHWGNYPHVVIWWEVYLCVIRIGILYFHIFFPRGSMYRDNNKYPSTDSVRNPYFTHNAALLLGNWTFCLWTPWQSNTDWLHISAYLTPGLNCGFRSISTVVAAWWCSG